MFSEFSVGKPGAKYMIRRGDYKLNLYANAAPELFDLREDPKEMRNLAPLADYRGKVEEMKARLFAWHKPPELRAAALVPPAM